MGKADAKSKRKTKITPNGFFNFLNEFREQHATLRLIEATKKGAKKWNSFSGKKKEQYKIYGNYMKSRKPLGKPSLKVSPQRLRSRAKPPCKKSKKTVKKAPTKNMTKAKKQNSTRFKAARKILKKVKSSSTDMSIGNEDEAQNYTCDEEQSVSSDISNGNEDQAQDDYTCDEEQSVSDYQSVQSVGGLDTVEPLQSVGECDSMGESDSIGEARSLGQYSSLGEGDENDECESSSRFEDETKSLEDEKK